MRSKPLGALGLLGAAIAAYLPVWQAGYVWNDPDYVTRPALRSLDGLRRIWFELGATEQYYPLLHSALWVEHRLWGGAALGYHLLNVLLHAGSAILFWLALERLLAWRRAPDAALTGAAWFAALLFAVHPVMAESVAWISEQKNTLSLLFYLLAGLAYLRFAQAGRKPAYWAGLAAFVAALLCKSVTATLPAALLVVLWWRREPLRLHVRRLLPWFVLAAAWGLFSAWVEHTYVGARGAAFDLSFGARLLLACRIPWFYLQKLLVPYPLVFIYPRWTVTAEHPIFLLFPALLAAAALLAARFVREGARGPMAAGLFFIGSLFPTLGFLNVYAFLYSYVADHWDYIPALGLFAGAAYLLWTKLGRWTVLIAVPLAALTFRESRAYRNAGAFYRTIVDRNPGAWMAQNNLANLLAADGRLAEALPHYQAALDARSDLPETHYNYGVVLAKLGRWDDAAAQYRLALADRPDYAAAHQNLGTVLLHEHRAADAIPELRAAVRFQPKLASAHLDLGEALLAADEPAEAASEINRARELDPRLPGVRSTLAVAFNNAGVGSLNAQRYDLAAKQFTAAAQLDPAYAAAWANLGRALAASGRAAAAIAPLEEALRRDPASPETENDLGAIFALLHRPQDAIPHYERALQLRPGFAAAAANLAHARAALAR